MKKYLLLFLMCVYASIGAWAVAVTVSTDSNGLTTVTCTDNGNSEVTVTGSFPAEGSISNIKVVGPFTTGVSDKIAYALNNNFSSFTRLDLSEATGVTTSTLSTYSIVGWGKMGYIKHLILPKGASVPTAEQLKNNASGSLDPWDHMEYFVIPQSDGTCDIYLTEVGLTSIADADIIITDKSTSTVAVHLAEGDDENPATEATKTTIENYLKTQGYKLFVAPYTVSGCNVSINMDGAEAGKTLADLINSAKGETTGNSICTLNVVGEIDDTDLAALGGSDMSGATRINLAKATIASGSALTSIVLPASLTQLVLPENTTVSSTLADVLDNYANLTYAYSPSSDSQLPGPNEESSFDDRYNKIADYVWVIQSGGLANAFTYEEQLRNSYYIKVASGDAALNTTDVNFDGLGAYKPTNYLFLDLSGANLAPAMAANYRVTDNIGYRIILPDNWTGDQMAVFAALPQTAEGEAPARGNLAAVYSYHGTHLQILEITDESYSQSALANPRIVRSGTTKVEVISGTYNGTTYANFGDNLLAALNNMGKSSFSVTVGGATTNYTNDVGLTVTTVSIETGSNVPNAITFNNPTIQTLELKNVGQGWSSLNVDACSSLQTLNLNYINLGNVSAKVPAASPKTGLTSINLSGATINGSADFSTSPLTSAFTMDDDTYITSNLLLMSTGLTSFTPHGTIGGDIYLNASNNLESLDVRQFTQAASKKIHIDADATENESNTNVIDKLEVANAVTVPSDYVIADHFHPAIDAAFVKREAYVPPMYTTSTTTMVLHEKNTNSDGDNYIYWYNDTTNPGTNVTLGTSAASGHSLAEILTSEASIGTTTYRRAKIDGPIISTDVDDLTRINCQVLDLSDATFDEAAWAALKTAFAESGTGVHSNVRFVILPDNSTREDIINGTALAGLANVLSVIALNKITGAADESDNGTNLTSWNRVSGALQAAVVAAGNHSCQSWTKTPDGETDRNIYTSDISDFRECKISGLINSYDLSKANQNLDANGHLSWDKEPVELSSGTDPRKLNGACTAYGPFSSSFNLSVIDLKGAFFEEKGDNTHLADKDKRYYFQDMTLSALGIISSGTYKVVVPTDPRAKEIPADFMSGVTHIRAICIPSNIVAIRTRAFYSIDYIWTTATNLAGTVDPEGSNTRLDNGAKLSNGTPVTALIYQDGAYKENPAFTKAYYTADYSTIKGGGTYTFGSNLRLIETGAFANTQPHVKDVYVLNTTAPECHVDAFNTVMYNGNGGYSSISGDQKIISRENYSNNGFWITMLHYPRQTTTPNVQRYTDPTREYSIATGERDGKGAPIYFPNQSEFIRAYMQGTYGYVWNAWNPTREYGSVNNEPLTNTTAGWKATGQTAANALFDEYPSGVNHEYTSFYKVSGLTGETVTAPTKTLVPYYQVNWNETSYSTATPGNLYPQSEIDANSDADKSGEKTTKDYRGWHQFVLNAYAANTVLKEEPYRSYITDNEWWTICPTFDITRAEAIMLFGCPSTWNPSSVELVPYVSKLRYVRRTYGDEKITLNFSANLMNHKEARSALEEGETLLPGTTAKQHGAKDENGILVVGSGEGTGLTGNGDVVMSAGVPYLIKPNIKAFDGVLNRQFRVYTDEDYEKLSAEQKSATNPRAIKSTSLYNKIKAAQALPGTDQIALINSGKYTVPVFVSGRTTSTGVETENVEMESDGITPKSYTVAESPYEKSTTWKYTFVGSFYKSFLPHYCYYLGWDSSLNSGNGGARFFYLDGEKGNPGVFTYYDNNMNWNNETGVICPTKGTFGYTITPASGLLPATWIIGADGTKGMRTSGTAANNEFLPDDSYVPLSGGSGAKVYEMLIGAPDVFSVNDETTGIENVNDNTNVNNNEKNDVNVYTINGQKVGTSLEGLPKGIYIVNGKKFIVK